MKKFSFQLTAYVYQFIFPIYRVITHFDWFHFQDGSEVPVRDFRVDEAIYSYLSIMDVLAVSWMFHTSNILSATALLDDSAYFQNVFVICKADW